MSGREECFTDSVGLGDPEAVRTWEVVHSEATKTVQVPSSPPVARAGVSSLTRVQDPVRCRRVGPVGVFLGSFGWGGVRLVFSFLEFAFHFSVLLVVPQRGRHSDLRIGEFSSSSTSPLCEPAGLMCV